MGLDKGDPSMIRDFTVIYQDSSKAQHKLHLKAYSCAHAVISAMELLPSCVDIVRTYHDPNW